MPSPEGFPVHDRRNRWKLVQDMCPIYVLPCLCAYVSAQLDPTFLSTIHTRLVACFQWTLTAITQKL